MIDKRAILVVAFTALLVPTLGENDGQRPTEIKRFRDSYARAVREQDGQRPTEIKIFRNIHERELGIEKRAALKRTTGLSELTEIFGTRIGGADVEGFPNAGLCGLCLGFMVDVELALVELVIDPVEAILETGCGFIPFFGDECVNAVSTFFGDQVIPFLTDLIPLETLVCGLFC